MKKNNRILTFNVEDIEQFHPNLNLEHVVYCLVALIAEKGIDNCSFTVECRGLKLEYADEEEKVRLCLKWRKETAKRAARTLQTYHRHHVIEQAAVAITCILFPKFIPLCPLRVAQIGEGGDYWLGDQEYIVEISGTEQSGELERRHRQKVEQLLSGAHKFDGYVVVCCFTTRRSIFSFHPREVNNEEKTDT